jgi:hypothetical protein
MILLRILLIAFNVAVIGFLIYRMVEFMQKPVERSKKVTFIIGGTILLLIPFGIFLRFFAPSPTYLVVYPVAIGLFLYLTKRL